MSSEEKFLGTIVHFNGINEECNKGYGFIRPEDTLTGADVWFGAFAVKNVAPIKIGDLVRYTLKPDPKGGRPIVRCCYRP